MPSPSGTEITAVYEDVDYYGACGNETLTTDEGISFYPLTPEEVEALDLDAYSDDGARPTPARRVSGRPWGSPRRGRVTTWEPSSSTAMASPGSSRTAGTVRWLTDEFREVHLRLPSGSSRWR